MSDISSLALDTSILTSAINSTANTVLTNTQATAQGSAASSMLSSDSSVQTTNTSKEQGVYAVKGDSQYKEEMDLNVDGTITNAEMTQYYAKIASDYGSGVSSLQDNSVGNVVTTSQAANAYMSNEAAYSAAYTSLIETSA